MSEQEPWRAINFDDLPSVGSVAVDAHTARPPRFDGDSSAMSDRACWTLQNLLKSRYIRKATDPELWSWMMQYRSDIESRLCELNLRLKVVDDIETAFAEPMDDPSRWARRIVRRETLGTYDAILALQLTKLMRISHDEDAIISRTDLHELFSGVSHATNTDRVKFESRINGAIAKLVSTTLLNKVGDDEDSSTINPVIIAVMSASLVAELDRKFEQLTADKLAAAGNAEEGTTMTTMPLDITTDIDQYRLARLQVVNWGVFDNYHSIDFAPKGTLIAGRSGSGKSTLLDAISLGFLPSKRRNFNASSDIGQRTVDKYIRGQWGEHRAGTDDRTLMYLRGDGAAWSAIALTYSSTFGKNVTGLVLKRLPADKVSDPISDYYLIDQPADIHDLCNEWVVKGFSSAVLRDAGWRGGGKSHNETWYLSQLYASIGIRASEAAQQLLGKAKSLKSVGGLEKFVRDYMLDEPESIKDIASALAQIDPLVSARDNLEVARSKYSTLDGIDDAYGTFVEESTRLASVTMIDKPMVFDFVDHLRKDKCGPEIARLDRELSEIGADCTGLEERKQAAYTHLSVLIGRVSAASNNLAPVEFALQQARVRAEDVQRNADDTSC